MEQETLDIKEVLLDEISSIISIIPAKNRHNQMFYLSQTIKESEKGNMAEVDLSLKQQAIQLKSLSIETVIDNETTDDLAAYHGIKATDHIESILLNSLMLKTTKNVIDKISKTADKSYHKNIGFIQDLFLLKKKNKISKMFYKFIFWFYRTLLKKEKTVRFSFKNMEDISSYLIQFSAILHKLSLRGGANFIIINQSLLPLFHNLQRFKSSSEISANLSLIKVGNFAERFSIFISSDVKENEIILGRKGRDEESGIKLVYRADSYQFLQAKAHISPFETKTRVRACFDAEVAEVGDAENSYIKMLVNYKSKN